MVTETLLYSVGVVSFLCVVGIIWQIFFLTKDERQAVPVLKDKDTPSQNQKKAA